MDVRSAELTKYAANAMLATRISFMNELALLAEKLGADIEAVRKGIGSDPRIGYALPVRRLRLWRQLLPQGRESADQDSGQRRRARSAGAARPWKRPTTPRSMYWWTRCCRRLATTSTGKHFALWGLAFKPNTDDMREATSRVVIRAVASAVPR
jgi:UDPglucose 6-dehydrogenase